MRKLVLALCLVLGFTTWGFGDDELNLSTQKADKCLDYAGYSEKGLPAGTQEEFSKCNMDLIQKCLFDNSCTDCLAMILVNYILGRDNPSAFDQSEKNIRFTIEKRSHICPIVEDVGVDMLKKLKEDNKK